MALHVHDLLDETVLRSPGKVALMTDEATLTYTQLAERSRCLAGRFWERGVRRGDRVAVFLPNQAEAVTTIMAASRIGAIFTLIHASVKPYNLAHIFSDCAPALIVSTSLRASRFGLSRWAPVLSVDEEWDQTASGQFSPPPFMGISSDPVCLIYTSGTSGRPKAVISSHRNVVFATKAIQDCLRIREDDRIGSFLPLSFDYGLYQLFLTMCSGASLALGREDQAGPSLLVKLREWQVTGLPVVPSLASLVVRMARRDRERLPALRFITNTGAFLPGSIISDLGSLFPQAKAFVMFGLTECKRVSILQPEDYKRKPDSVGRPLPDTECLIVDANGQPVSPGVVGELVVRGPHVMSGYWRADPEQNSTRFRLWGPGLERVLFTGDLCSLDEEGFLYYHGRSDDLYKQSGYRVSPLEVESAALDITHVQQAAVTPPSGAVGAVLFVTGSLPPEAVMSELRIRLEDYKLPEKVLALSEMPLTPNGKVDKAVLRTLLHGGERKA